MFNRGKKLYKLLSIMLSIIIAISATPLLTIIGTAAELQEQETGQSILNTDLQSEDQTIANENIIGLEPELIQNNDPFATMYDSDMLVMEELRAENTFINTEAEYEASDEPDRDNLGDTKAREEEEFIRQRELELHDEYMQNRLKEHKGTVHMC